MAINSYKHWTEEDIDTLDKLYKMNLSIEQIARCLNRTERSIEHAIKNLLIQQVLHHTTENVMNEYDLQKQALYEELVPDKYYPNKTKNTSCPAWPIVMAGCILYLCVAGFGYYDKYSSF